MQLTCNFGQLSNDFLAIYLINFPNSIYCKFHDAQKILCVLSVRIRFSIDASTITSTWSDLNCNSNPLCTIQSELQFQVTLYYPKRIAIPSHFALYEVNCNSKTLCTIQSALQFQVTSHYTKTIPNFLNPCKSKLHRTYIFRLCNIGRATKVQTDESDLGARRFNPE